MKANIAAPTTAGYAGGMGYQTSPGVQKPAYNNAPNFNGWQGPKPGMLSGMQLEQVQMTPEEAFLIACSTGMPQGGGGNGAVAPAPRPFSNPTGYNPVSAPTVQPVNDKGFMGPGGYQPATSYASVGQSMSPQTPWMPPSFPGFGAGPLGQAQAFNGLGGPQGSGAGSMQGMLSQLLMALRGNVGF